MDILSYSIPQGCIFRTHKEGVILRWVNTGEGSMKKGCLIHTFILQKNNRYAKSLLDYLSIRPEQELRARTKESYETSYF